MLYAEAIRLAAIEVLCPTGATSFPTLAGGLVYDSRAPSVRDIDNDRPYTPTLALYTVQASTSLRSEASAAFDTDTKCVLDVVAELTVASEEDGQVMTDAMAESDPEARLVLAALVSQARYALERSLTGYMFRRLVRAINSIDSMTTAVPELGLRWHRVTTRFNISCSDDRFDPQAGGLPEPLKSIADQLPEASYAKEKLQALGAYFQPLGAPALQQVRVATDGIVSGL